MNHILILLITLYLMAISSGSLLSGVEIRRSNDKPSASEGATAIDGQFVITRGDDSIGQEITVRWQLGTPLKPATRTTDFLLFDASDEDITGASGEVIIPADQSSTTITVSPQTDTDLEGAEDVTIELLDDIEFPATYIVGTNQSATITIADNDVLISLSVPSNSVAYEDYTPNAGIIEDPDRNRRASFRATISPAPTFSTYVGVALAPGGAPGLATLNTDYHVVYKIGGGSLGSGINYTIRPRYAYQSGATQIVVDGGSAPIMPNATFTFSGHATTYTTSGGLGGTSGTLTFTPPLTTQVSDNMTLTVIQPTVASGFHVNDSGANLGDTQVEVDDGNGAIPAGARITFSDHVMVYTVTNSTVGADGSGRLTFSSGLTQLVADNTSFTVAYPNATGFAVNQTNSIEPIGITSLMVDGGLGGFAVGDVFRIGTQISPQYVVTNWTPGSGSTGTIAFITFTGSGGPGGGLAQTINGATALSTHFPAVFSGVSNNEVRVLIPGSATKVEYGIVPDSDALAEGFETVTMSMVTSTDYLVSGTRNLRISDDDVIVAFDPTQSRNATVGGSDGSFRIVLTSAFPQDVNIAYTISGTADNSGSPTDPSTGDLDPIPANITLTANTTSATIPIHGREGNNSDSKILTLTLLPSDEFRLVTTPGATQNSSASISINHPLGTVSVSPKSGSSIAQEKLVSPVSGIFTVSVTPAPTSDLTVAYTIGGTASSGVDYTTLSGNVTILADESTAEISVVPLDDTVPDAGETVVVTLQTGLNYLVSGTANSAAVTIADDEPAVSIGRTAHITEGETNKTVFTVTSATAVPRNTVVDLTWSGTSVASDRSVPANVTILAGQTSVIVPLSATNDGLVEGDETLTATISDKPAVYTRVTNSATATISDFLPTLSLSVDRNGVEGSATKGRFKITCSTVPVLPITVAYTVSTTSTATAGAAVGSGIDYKTLPLTVDVTTTETFIEVQVFDDTVYDPFETVIIALTDQTPPSFVHAGTPPLTATMTLQDAQVGVASVTSASANGNYTVGNTIAIAVAFSEDITVTGAPTLLLETGASDATATFVNRSPTNTLNFLYTVRATDVSADLDYQSSTALSLNGGTITGGTPTTAARLTLPVPGATGSLSASKSIAVDGGSTDGKPTPGAVGPDSGGGGGCGLGSGIAGLVLCMLAGFALSILRFRR